VEIAVLSIFCAALLACVIAKLSILYALALGLAIFLIYGKIKHFTWKQLGAMVASGIKTVRGILIVFLLIGILTAVWRTSGTIPVIISLAMRLVQPHLMILLAFLLNCVVSVLTGTAFGTAATMGVICMTMAASMGINPVLMGGAILSGVFFGDRCSPISTSALLVAQLTHANIFTNIRNMLRTAAIPFALTCATYGVAGVLLSARSGNVNVGAIFSREFDMRWFMVTPAVLMLVLAVAKIDVKIAMSASIVTAVAMSYFVQGVGPASLGWEIVFGYSARTHQVGALLNGGGIVSMLTVGAIVCLSSAYAGIFERTGMLAGVKGLIGRLEGAAGDFVGTLVTSVVAAMVACNQTLAIMLTNQLCDDVAATAAESERERKALNLEDSVVVVSPLIPWSIAGAVPLGSAGAPLVSVIAACFLYLLPLSRLVFSLIRRVRAKRAARLVE
jgi:NhaC family Na+:H+ antiporter